MSSPAPSADRNLILGLLALQMDFLTREQLLDAMNAWMLRKTTPLGDILRERGVLSERRLELLHGMVEEHVEQHGDAQASLAALRVEASVRHDLDRLDDADVQASLASLAARTRPGASEDSLSSPAIVAPSRSAPLANGMRFRPLREHARGGLGEVFVAEDEELHREVALKQIQDRFADQLDARYRFVREAEITGHLEHPGVVPVYGLGAYPDGRPYYAMRFIHGESLAEAIQRFHQADEDPRRDAGERSLALRELLGRFVAVCQAVGYAHARGVVHRDLKPANVMLGEYGETLVVDWGLAKVLASGGRQPPEQHADAEETTAGSPVRISAGGGSTATELGQVLGTPAYMPPEQAAGKHDEVGIASDVFALAATLYCLLTGGPPYQGHDAIVQAALGNVVPARQRKPSVPASLEAICSKAMAAHPAERYRTAGSLAIDVQRWLAGEPVSAYREPLMERLRRWGRRHRTLVSVGVALLLAGVVALTVGLWLVNAERTRTASERDRALRAEAEATENLEQAQKNLTLARRAIDECYNVAYKDPLFQGPRMEKARNLLLRKTLDYYKNFRSQRPDDRGLQHEEAEQWFRVGNIEQVLLRTKEAQQAYVRARELFQALEARHPDVPAYQNDLARTHNNLGNLLTALGQRPEALQEYQQARTLQQKLVQSYPDVPAYQNDLAGTHHNLGARLSVLGQRPEALREYQQARTLRLKLVQSHPEQPQYQNDLASTHNNLGLLLSELGQQPEALQEYRQARTLRLKLVQRHPDVPAYQNDLANTHNNLGILLTALGQRPEALQEYQQARTLQQKLVQSHPDVPEYQNDLASTHNNLSMLLSVLGQLPQALQEYQQARTLRLKLVQRYPDVPAYQNDLAGTHNNLGALLGALGQRPEALQEFRQARTLQQKLVQTRPDVPDYAVRLARTCFNCTLLLLQLNRPAEALAVLDEGLHQADRLGKLDPKNPMSATFLLFGLPRRAALLTRLGHGQQADADWDRVLKIAPVARRAGLRLQRAASRARAGDYLRAAAEANNLAAAEAAADTLYNLACIHALNAGSAARAAARPLPERETRSEQFASAAVALLHRAVKAGYKDAEHMARDIDLDALRQRDDFKKLLESLVKPKEKVPAGKGQ
jgi:serine/threonine-protein kinase